MPVPEIVLLPWCFISDRVGGDGVAVDEDLDGADVAGEVPGVGVGPRERGGADFRVVLGDRGERWPSQACSSNRVIGSLAL